jgi:hypothetical protein
MKENNVTINWIDSRFELPNHTKKVFAMCKPKYLIEDGVCGLDDDYMQLHFASYCQIDKIWVLESNDLDECYVYFWAEIPNNFQPIHLKYI